MNTPSIKFFDGIIDQIIIQNKTTNNWSLKHAKYIYFLVSGGKNFTPTANCRVSVTPLFNLFIKQHWKHSQGPGKEILK